TLHRFARQFGGIHAAGRHLCLIVALGVRRLDHPLVYLLLQFRQSIITPGGGGMVFQPAFGETLRQNSVKRLLRRAYTTNFRCANWYPYGVAPNLGIESPPVATTRAGARNSPASVRTMNSVVRCTSRIRLCRKICTPAARHSDSSNSVMSSAERSQKSCPSVF